HSRTAGIKKGGSCQQSLLIEMNRTYIALISVLALILGTTVLGQNPQAQSDLYPFIKNDKLGFIDRSGREVIPAQFSTAADATVFREGIANVGATGAGPTLTDRANSSSNRNSGGHIHFQRDMPASCCRE